MNTFKLSAIFVPGTLTIEDYGHNRATKVYLAGKFHDGVWRALYGDLQPDARAQIQANVVDGSISAVQLVRQHGGEHIGKLVAIAIPRCMIGSYRFAIVDSLGDCILPHPFESLDDLVRL